jgi:hypothetical protein
LKQSPKKWSRQPVFTLTNRQQLVWFHGIRCIYSCRRYSR